MCVGPLKPSKPPPLPPIADPRDFGEAPKEAPKRTSANEKVARAQERKRLASLKGARSTLLTGPQGLLTPASTGRAGLLSGSPIYNA